MVEINYQFRPWVKRTARLALGAGVVMVLGSYALVVRAFYPN